MSLTAMPIRWISTSPAGLWNEKDPKPTLSAPQLTVTDRTQQTIDDFGACFNEMGWQTLQSLPDDLQHQVLRNLFDPADGCGFRLGRVPIGASDYALEWYSCNERDGDLSMEHFSIERDERMLIPFICKALELQPELRLFVSPWSPPTWMKEPRVYNGGRLRWEPEILEAYALYLHRFVDAYQSKDIPIRQLHLQNEPDSTQVFPSCLWSGAQMRDFIRDHLGPRFQAEGVDCEIWAGTLERADYDAWAHTILHDPKVRAFVSGVGFQWAGKGAVQRTHQSWPDLRLWQTENECGDGQNTWAYAHYVFSLLHHYLSNGVNAYLYWNMVLPPGGRSTRGWFQNSLITIDPIKQTVTYNPEFYVMRHISQFVPPGSTRLELSGEWSGNALTFKTPDGGTVVNCANPFFHPVDLVVDVAGNCHEFSLEAQSSIHSWLPTKVGRAVR